MTKLTREIIGRSAIGVLGVALLYGGFVCLRTGWEIDRDPGAGGTHRRSIRRQTSGLPYAAGVVLLVFGVPLTVAAVVPTHVFERFIGPPNQTTLHDNDYDGRRWY
jgi:hypothetical protein